MSSFNIWDAGFSTSKPGDMKNSYGLQQRFQPPEQARVEVEASKIKVYDNKGVMRVQRGDRTALNETMSARPASTPKDTPAPTLERPSHIPESSTDAW